MTHLIWSNEHRSWWRASVAGYTADVWHAGHHAADEATARVSPNIRTSDGRGPKDVVVAAPELDADTFTITAIRRLPDLLERRARETVEAAGGIARHGGDPNWKPLESVLPLDECGNWMWMSFQRHGDRIIEAYKHHDTRGYLHLDQGGQAWRFEPTGPEECDPWCDKAHEHVKGRQVVATQMDLADALKWARL